MGAGAAGAWADYGDLAIDSALAWRFLAPREGWRMACWDEAAFLIFDGTSWNDLRDIEALNWLLGLGDARHGRQLEAGDRLGAGALFTHESGDHRMTLNKSRRRAIPGRCCSRPAIPGRAELGLAGDDDFHFKVSADGVNLFEGQLRIDRGWARCASPAARAWRWITPRQSWPTTSR